MSERETLKSTCEALTEAATREAEAARRAISERDVANDARRETSQRS